MSEVGSNITCCDLKGLSADAYKKHLTEVEHTWAGFYPCKDCKTPVPTSGKKFKLTQYMTVHEIPVYCADCAKIPKVEAI